MKVRNAMRTELPRQMVHLSGIIFVIFAQFIGREMTVIYFSLITLFFFIYSWYVRTQEKKLENFLGKFESRLRDFTLKFERKHVKNPFTGAMFFYLGCTLAFVFFPFSIASAACAMLAVGDALSTLVGENLGKRKIGSKTFEGFAACFLGSVAGGIFFASPFITVIGALTASFAELIPGIDDNLTIPILAGLVMFLATLV
jgi:dolichol kinase